MNNLSHTPAIWRSERNLGDIRLTLLSSCRRFLMIYNVFILLHLCFSNKTSSVVLSFFLKRCMESEHRCDTTLSRIICVDNQKKGSERLQSSMSCHTNEYNLINARRFFVQLSLYVCKNCVKSIFSFVSFIAPNFIIPNRIGFHGAWRLEAMRNCHCRCMTRKKGGQRTRGKIHCEVHIDCSSALYAALRE